MEKSITHTYHIGGMSCGGCAATVKQRLSDVVGVTAVKVDLETKKAEISSTHLININVLQSALGINSYTVSELEAPVIL
jgi:copper chaperone